MMNRTSLLALLIMFIMGLLVTTAPAFAQDGEDELMITAIEIRGNERISDQDILAVMQGRAGDTFSLNTLSTDLAAISALGWFAAEPEHILEPFEGGVKIIIVLIENPEYVGVSITQVGPGIYPIAELAVLFHMEPGTLLNNTMVAEGLQGIERRYRDDGYTAATVTDIEIGDDGIVNVTINEGVISQIVIEGNTKTRTHVIMREIQTEIGDVFNAVVFRRDLERVYNLQLFEDLTPSFELDENREVILRITVIEAKTGQFGFGGGYSSNDGFLATLSYGETNFRGLGQRLNALAQFGGPNPDFNVSFYNPVIDNQRTSFSIEGFIMNETDRIRIDNSEEHAENPDAPEEIIYPYELERTGGSIGLVRPLNDDVTVSINFRSIDGEVTFLDDETNEPIDPSEEPDLSDNEWINRGLIDGMSNSLTARVAYDTRDFTLDPSQGLLASAQTSMIGHILGGDFDAFKYQFEIRNFIPLSSPSIDISDLSPTRYRETHVFAWRLLYGTSTGDLPLLERFKVGGQNSVRGTRETAQAGNEAVLFNAEYRFPLGGNLSGAAFFDAGAAAEPGSSLEFDNLVTTIGIGIRYRISFFGIAPLRLDYGYDLDEQEGTIVFGFGHLF